MKPDVIVTWPTHCDFPLWRKQIERDRARIDKLIIVFSDHQHGPDMKAHVATQLPWAKFLHAPTHPGDWRNNAVNMALEICTSEWVWFTEQDFTFHEAYWGRIHVSSWGGGRQASGWRDETRWHPSCLFARRWLVEQTSKYFGTPPVDHFWQFSREIDEITVNIANLDTWWFKHMAGLSDNHRILFQRDYDALYKPDELTTYLHSCLASGMVLESAWLESVQAFLEA